MKTMLAGMRMSNKCGSEKLQGAIFCKMSHIFCHSKVEVGKETLTKAEIRHFQLFSTLTSYPISQQMCVLLPFLPECFSKDIRSLILKILQIKVLHSDILVLSVPQCDDQCYRSLFWDLWERSRS